ncbi:hypothetical protein GW17_00006529 [Ensete ventricosum]|nr:hypothetical protein GW17_00006529 [Ensete ventricosum]
MTRSKKTLVNYTTSRQDLGGWWGKLDTSGHWTWAQNESKESDDRVSDLGWPVEVGGASEVPCSGIGCLPPYDSSFDGQPSQACLSDTGGSEGARKRVDEGNDRLHHSGQGIDLFCQAKKRLRRDDGLPRTSLRVREPRVIEQTPAPTRDVKHPIRFVPDTFAGSVPKLFQLTSHELAS